MHADVTAAKSAPFPTICKMSAWDAPAAPARAKADAWGAAPAATTDNANRAAATSSGAAWGSAESVQPVRAEQTAQQPSREEDLARARAAGWRERSIFNYAVFQRMGGNDGNWLGQAQGYDWRDEYGEVGPQVPELEAKLFGGESKMKKGDRIDIFENVEINIDGPDKLEPVRNVSKPDLQGAATSADKSL